MKYKISFNLESSCTIEADTFDEAVKIAKEYAKIKFTGKEGKEVKA